MKNKMMVYVTFVATLHVVYCASVATVEPITAAVTTEESLEGRGKLKFGDKCEYTKQCGFRGSICDPNKKSCQCLPELTATNHIDKCGKMAKVNESCFFNEQCEAMTFQTECRNDHCICRNELTPLLKDDGTVHCVAVARPTESTTHVDPAMIGILAGMALMFIIICVVLRLFSQARWRENRTIFNTPNPRLMNVSLLQHNKNLHDQRRGSKGSKGPSRAPSVTSLRPQSPSASQGSKSGSRCNSRGSNHSPKDRSPTRVTSNNHSGLESVSVDKQ